jgi:hypothetical protein
LLNCNRLNTENVVFELVKENSDYWDYLIKWENKILNFEWRYVIKSNKIFFEKFMRRLNLLNSAYSLR